MKSGSRMRPEFKETFVLVPRTRLAELTGVIGAQNPARGDGAQHENWKDEHAQVRAKTLTLASMFASAVISKPTNDTAKDIELSIFSTTLDSRYNRAQPIILTLKAPSEFPQSGWQFVHARIEPVVSLWVWTMLSDPDMIHNNYDGSEYNVSDAGNIRNARIVSFGVDDSIRQTQVDTQEEMDLWLGRSSA